MILSRRGRGMEPVERLHCLRDMCGSPDANGDDIGVFLLSEVQRLRKGIQAAKKTHERLKEIVEQLTAPPVHPAIFLGWIAVGERRMALVSQGSTQCAVMIADGVDTGGLAAGDEVLLSHDRNALLARSALPMLPCGETAVFDRHTPDGRLVIKWRDEEIVVGRGGKLEARPPRRGDAIRWDRNAWLALEVLERPAAEYLFVQETPAETFADIGGLDDVIAEIKLAFLLHFRHPEAAREFHVRRCGAVTLEGPPGTGKTMLAKAVANWVGTLSSTGRSRFINVKPGSLKSVWYSQTEANIRNLFQSARELAETEPAIPVVIFMDEIDSLAMTRTGSMFHIDDRVQQAFAAELNGFEARGNVMIVCATNRVDALDPALVREGRLGDRVITVPRPNQAATRAIFGKYLGPELPYAANGHDPAAVREEIIESAVARIFAPNGSRDLAVLCLRDGKRMAVKPSQLISGAMIAAIANDACEGACLRKVEDRPGPRGVSWPDVESSLVRRLEQAAGLLTPRNCRGHLGGLPEDVDVVAIDRRQRKAIQEYRYVVAG
jgi:proteasome-associated ATPase